MSAPVAGAAGAGAGAVTAKPETGGKVNWGAVIAMGLGTVTLVACILAQFGVMAHGSSGQLSIENGLNGSLWGILTGAVLLCIGLILWVSLMNSDYKFMGTFCIAYLSYLVSCAAMFMSSFQVIVKTS